MPKKDESVRVENRILNEFCKKKKLVEWRSLGVALELRILL